jgi:hypothetical protein
VNTATIDPPHIVAIDPSCAVHGDCPTCGAPRNSDGECLNPFCGYDDFEEAFGP